ncbi:unnamed protein product [Durusdinium trenchii]|uniref:PsbP C-terminal domain-containing protein n=1 Tax=Durusdinium trenchii TaxID=1381693 RepID=A0ABP0JF27_9DINO
MLLRSLCFLLRCLLSSKHGAVEVLPALLTVAFLSGSRPAAVPRSWLRTLLVLPLPAEAQVSAGLRSLARSSRPKPETGVQLSSLGVMEGQADESGLHLVAAEVLGSNNQRITVSFSTSWPVTSDRSASSKSLEVRSKGATIFLQVIRGLALTSENLVEEVLSSKGKFGAYGLPDAVEVVKDNIQDDRRQMTIQFTSYSPRGVGFSYRAMLQAIPVNGDIFVLVGSALEEKWPEDQIRRTLSSFRVDASKAAET